MEGKYFDLVCCTIGDKKHLFIAPMCSGLNPGDVVIVEPWDCKSAMRGIVRATVREVVEAATEQSEYYQFILSVCANMLPLRRIKSKVTYSNMDYSDYDDDCGVNGAEVSE